MSTRRPNAAAERNANAQSILKSLLKLESNKSCCDCKRNKHPRWASWNLGIFVCIRCSGIHRGMGTHISRVKSVDLDSWTDEQLQSMLKWGNGRANKYWEAKLAPGHVPAEAKMENFIRTKYESKRWATDGAIPDPATLDSAGDDDVPLNVVQEKAKLERSASQKNGTAVAPPPRRQPANIDLFGDDPTPTPIRPVTTEPAVTSRPLPPKAPAAPPKQPPKQGDSLLGLDFFGGTQSAPPARPSSASSGMSSSGMPQRTDLKQSILSLYASAPRAAAPPPSQTSSQSLAGLQSPPIQSPLQQQPPSQGLAGMSDAFGGLSFSTPSVQQPIIKASPFSNLSSTSNNKQPSISANAGGSFFDTKPASVTQRSPPLSKPQIPRMSSGFGDFGDFTAAEPSPTTTAPAAASTMGNLFDLSGPAQAPAPQAASRPPPVTAASFTSNNAFNLSSPAPTPAPKAAPAPVQATNFSSMSNMDAWGSNDAWSTPDPAPASAPAPQAAATSTYTAPAPAPISASADFGGWGSNDATTSSQPTVTQDDDFGGWSSASPVATTAPAKTPTTSKPMSGGDDLFGNVWE